MSRLFVEQLTVIDCAYLDAERGLVGESWIADLELEGDLDAQSMVLDFGAVKKRLKQALDDSADHTLLAPGRSPALQWHQQAGRADLHFESQVGDYEHSSPAQAVTLIDRERIDAAALVAHLLPILKAAVPANVADVGLQLRAEQHDDAYYHYTHGLKKHDGQCQRIAHGHRSRVQVRVQGVRAPDLESMLSRRWCDIYLGSREDIVSWSAEQLRYAYEAREGRFELAVPTSRNDVLDSDTTVECIANALAWHVAELHPGSEVEIKAYEGYLKGAVARATR